MSEVNKQIRVIKYSSDSSRKINNNNPNNENPILRKNWKCYAIPISIAVLIIIAASIVIAILFNQKKPQVEPTDVIDTNNIPTEEIIMNINPEIPKYMKEKGPLEMQTEYKIKTNERDFKRIFINQKYYEDIKIDGFLSNNIVDRKTNYDIFVIKIIESPDELKYFYNYTYFCSISISSECISSKNEYCVPKKLVDLTDLDNSNLRNTQEIDSLENFPIPLCFFNITENNVITSIACHKKLNESKINSIILDLYFYRPPGIKRINEKEANITIVGEKTENYEIIKETNGGICDIDDPIGSFCTTEMKTTKDLDSNLVAYDEKAFTNITKDENNYYIKNKITQLIDKTSYLSEFDSEKYNETLYKLYPNLEDYLKYYEQFSLENFKDLYNVSKGIKDESQSKRRLSKEKQAIVEKRKFFDFSHYGGVNIQISLLDNVGYNSQAMVASNFIQIDDKKENLAELKQFTDIDKCIKKLIHLSKAGNKLATNLYNKIKENLNNITDIISINIPSINSLLAYKELTDIFDSTFSLKNLKIVPYGIIEESDYLINKLEEIYNGIDNGILKNHIVVLNNYLYQYIKQSHILIDRISNNLTELKNLIKSPKQKISDISYYYMKNTTVSYINIINDAKNILLNYYENEKDLIIPKVKELLANFENITIESLERQINLVNNLNNKLDSKELTIVNSTDEDYRKIIVNLHNSNNYINNIITLFKKKVENEMDLKNGYFISEYDIYSNNETFSRVIDEALTEAKKLDDNEYVDLLFDEIMTTFRINFIDITKQMDLQKEGNFVPDENTLKGGYFPISEQQHITNELRVLSDEIISKVKEENNLYLDKVNKVINEFLDNNKDYLNQLIMEINILFSKDSLDNIAKSYNNSFNRHINKLIDDIEYNKNLTKEYFDGLHGLMTNNTKIIELLQTFTENRQYEKYSQYCKTNDTVVEIHCINNTFFRDQITSKKIGNNYFNKYTNFKDKFDASKEYIKSDLKINFLNEYKNIINKLKGVLQTFKNNKMSDKYPKYIDLYFIDNHIKNIDELYNRLNKYISDEIFNSYYLPKLSYYKLNQSEKIDNIKSYIENKHKLIYVGQVGKDKDFCTTFKRKRTFTCRNGAIYNYDNSEDECLDSWGSSNLGNMVEISFINDQIFEDEFDIFFSSIKEKIDSYNYLINELQTNITSIEKEILDMNIINNYLSSFENKVNLILSEKLSDNLINGSYYYYKNLLDKRLGNVLTNISNQWINSFEILETKVSNNLNNFNHSMNEFGVMALLYEAIISQNLTRDFYESIIKHQKSEFNYTISYYYNFLLENVTSFYQYIFNQIPTNQDGFNNITMLRKKEVEEKFEQLLEKIEESKLESLSIKNQISVLQVSSSNFFNTDSIFSKNNKETSTVLKNKGNTLYKLKNGKQNDEFSLACRFYLENSLNGLQIESYYQPINEKDNLFFYLNSKKFNELFSNNWIFDQDDFINKLNMTMYNSKLEIQNDISLKKEYYTELLEYEITKYEYSKENILDKVSLQYKSNIKDIDEIIKNKTINYINEILTLIKNYLINEEESLTVNLTTKYTNDFSTINETIQKYKDKIIEKLEEIILKIVGDFYEELKKEAYLEIVEPGLNIYLSKAEQYISYCQAHELFNTSYNIGEIIYDIVKNLVGEYKNITLKQIEYKHEEYIKKLKEELGIDEIKSLLEEEINSEYTKLLNILEDLTKNINPGTSGYINYDLKDGIKNAIDLRIEEIFKNINSTIFEIKVVNKKNLDWENLKLCYDSIDVETFPFIQKNFEQFITDEINIEKNNTNMFIKDIIRKNFNNIINNIIKTFGNDYFKRIIAYNENFKINSLYQNLKYSLVISLNYYQMLYNLKRQIKALTNDLKIKLYKLNDLDKIAEEENKIILKLLGIKIDEFIDETKRHIIKNYMDFLTSDTSIELSFGKSIHKIVENNLKDLGSELEKDYLNILNEQFKKKFINSYTQTMNEKTNDMIQTINELKQSIKSLFDDLFSLDVEKVLNQTNYQMNLTLNSIEEYKNHFDTFALPEDLINFSFNYGNNIIKPSYSKLESLINKETKTLTLNNIGNSSKEFEKSYENDSIIKLINTVNTSIDNNNNNILNAINSYGISEYPEILQNEINRIDRRALRELEDIQTPEDEIEEYQEKIADKSIDENFHKLLDISKNTRNSIQNYEYFDKFIESLEKKKKKINLSYKQSQQIINEGYEKNDELYTLLNNKLDNLTILSLNYYNEIENRFISLRNFTENLLYKIDDLLNECANITYKTFEEKYQEISEEAESIDNSQNNSERDLPSIEHTSSSQNNEYFTEATIISLLKKARFKFSLYLDEEEGKIKKPKILAIVNNEIKPEEMHLKISNKFGDCGEDYQEVDVKFNKVNYTIVLNFDTKSTLINVTTITDFDNYEYTVARYKRDESDGSKCSSSLGIGFCITDCEINEIQIIDEPRMKKESKIFQIEPKEIID